MKSRKAFIGYPIILIIVPAIAFFLMLGNGFSYLAADDNWMLYNNAQVFSLEPGNIIYYFTSFYHGQYSPINTLAYGVIYFFFGMNAFWYHLFSLVLHIVNTLLVYTFILSLLKSTAPGAALKLEGAASHAGTIAFLTALLFAIHPIQVESVAWISASKVLFYATLFLWSLLLYLKYVKTKRRSLYAFSLLLFIISFGIKEQTVILPLCLLLLDWYLQRDWKRGRLLLEKIPFFVVAIGLGIVELIGQQSFFGVNLETQYYPFFQRVLLACYALPEYLFKLILPLHLSYWYGFPMKPGEPVPGIFWFYPLVVLVLGYFLYRCWKAKKRYVLFGAGFFIINVALALHIIPMSRGVMMADRFMYLSSIGVFFIVSVFLYKLFSKMKRTEVSWYLYALAFFLYIIYLGSYAWFYAAQWR